MSAIPNESVPSLQEQLAAIDAKLDYVVRRQRFLEEMIDEMMPVGRQALSYGAERFAEVERKGWFEYSKVLFGTMDRLAEAYTVEDVRALSDSVVSIFDTVRNATQPDVLAVANEATEVLHHADEVRPVGLFGALRATRDDDVQMGLAVALQILEQLGKTAREVQHTGVPAVRQPPPKPRTADKPATTPEPEAVKAEPAEQPEAEEPDVVMWEGHAFNAEGFLVDPNTWNTDLATKIAAGLGITLTEQHWTVVRWVRQFYQTNGSSPNVRRMASGSGAGTAAMYQLFPKTPGKSCAMIAGVPKPVGCV